VGTVKRLQVALRALSGALRAVGRIQGGERRAPMRRTAEIEAAVPGRRMPEEMSMYDSRDYLGVSRQRVDQTRTVEGSTFPAGGPAQVGSLRDRGVGRARVVGPLLVEDARLVSLPQHRDEHCQIMPA
jgi:hypothetical protein